MENETEKYHVYTRPDNKSERGDVGDAEPAQY